MNTEYRCYTLTHFMLSSIQQGIQSGHAAMELVNKYYQPEPLYKDDEERFDTLLSWIREDKTIIALNGGNSEGLFEWYQFLNRPGYNTLPWVLFNEDENSLEGAMTSIAIIIPDRIYDFDTATHPQCTNWGGMFNNVPPEFTAWEWELFEKIKSAPLAR